MILDWETQAQDYYTIDIESDDLTAAKIWCLAYENLKTSESGLLVGEARISDFFKATKGSIYVGHNILKFDMPTINRLCSLSVPLENCIDTLVLSTLYNPSIEDGHSLEAWGERLKEPKIEFNDWSRYTDEMGVYCQQDVKLTSKLFRKIVKVLNKIGFSELSCRLQHDFTILLERQRKNGFYFDGERAIVMYQQLRDLEAELKEQVHVVFPPVLKHHRRYAKRFKKDGGFTKSYLDHVGQYPKLTLNADGSYDAYAWSSFNLGSPDQRVEKLLALGWQPDEHNPDELTKTGNPRPFHKGDLVPSLKLFLEETPTPEVYLIAKWMSINGRANMIGTWLDNWNEDTHCIHGSLFVADTLRLRHQKPNTANVPGVRVEEKKVDGKVVEKRILYGEEGFFTYESRDLWTARPGRVLVGTDAAGLELRMLAHYLNRPDFTEQVINGDPHAYNAQVAGVTRPTAKTLLYAIQYGAQAAKVASIIKSSKEEGAALRLQFLERLGLKGVMDAAIAEQKSGRVWLVDGSGVVCPSPHSALNYKLQGGGARVMAKGAVLLEQSIRHHGLDSLKVGDIHDEWQYDVAPSDAREHARLSEEAIRDAGEELGLNIPLAGEAKIGRTWAETH
jgi:DNA polymerase-1